MTQICPYLRIQYKHIGCTTQGLIQGGGRGTPVDWVSSHGSPRPPIDFNHQQKQLMEQFCLIKTVHTCVHRAKIGIKLMSGIQNVLSSFWRGHIPLPHPPRPPSLCRPNRHAVQLTTQSPLLHNFWICHCTAHNF